MGFVDSSPLIGEKLLRQEVGPFDHLSVEVVEGIDAGVPDGAPAANLALGTGKDPDAAVGQLDQTDVFHPIGARGERLEVSHILAPVKAGPPPEASRPCGMGKDLHAPDHQLTVDPEKKGSWSVKTGSPSRGRQAPSRSVKEDDFGVLAVPRLDPARDDGLLPVDKGSRNVVDVAVAHAGKREALAFQVEFFGVKFGK